MNLSLWIIVLMVLVVMPILIRQLFPKKIIEETVFLEPELKSEEVKTQSQDNLRNDPPTMHLENIITTSYLLPIQKQPQKITQKELSFEKIITIKAPTGQLFMGYALLQSLQNAGLHYSSKGFFYYIDHNDDKEANSLFELTPSIKPYRFNLAEIGILSTPGLILKLTESADEKTVQYIAEMLAEELGGVIEC